MKTGVPISQREPLVDTKGKLIGTKCTRFGNDGKTVISSESKFLDDSIYSRMVREYVSDGSYTKKFYAKDNSENLVQLGKYSKDGTLVRSIKLHKGTKNPAIITDYAGFGSVKKTQIFDIDGNLTSK